MKGNLSYSASILLFCFLNSLTIKSSEKVTFDHFFFSVRAPGLFVIIFSNEILQTSLCIVVA